MKDSDARQAALNPHKSFIVQAPAGSGKTQLLTARILSLLAHRVKSPESILAMTFTRKAAQEMKRRVFHALLLGKGPEPEEPHEKTMWTLAVAALKADETYGWNLLQNPQRLRIMTIDALCTSITHQLPLSSRLGVSPQSVEYARTLHIQAAQDTLNTLLEQHNPFVETLLLHLGNRQENACECIADMLAKRDQWLPLIFSHDTENLDRLRALLEENIARVIEDTLMQAMKATCDVDWDALSHFLLFAASHQETAVKQAEMESWVSLSPSIEDMASWRALCAWLCTTEGELRKTVMQRQGFPAPSAIKDKTMQAQAKIMKDGMIAWLNHVREDEDACDAIKSLSQLPDPTYSDRQWEVLKALFHILPEAVTALQALFTLRGEADFTAVTRCALTALGGDADPTDLDLKFDYALQHMLVDEFQDTSTTQFELIRRLVAHWDNSGEKTLFIVGDPMQSIYRFRQAEVGGYLQAQRYGMGPVMLEHLHLKANFRSQKPIIDWINARMPGVFSKKDDINAGAIAYAPFEAQRDDAPSSGVYVETHAELDVLTALLQDDTIQSIAILVRTRSHAEAILPLLRQANIPYQAVEIEHITQTPCVRQLLQLTHAYLNVANTQAWISVLMSPYAGLSLKDITHLQALAPTYWEALLQWKNASDISDAGRHILTRIAPILIGMIAHRHARSLAHAIEQTWFALGGPAALPNKESIADAEPYFDLLQSCDNGGTVDLIDFEAKLERLYSNAFKAAKVQIMTIHRAKGLEFDAVLIPSMDKQPRSSEKPLLLWESCALDIGHVFLFAPIHAAQEDMDPIFEFIWRKHKIREKHENARLLYVALTRAKKRLYLFGQSDAPKSNSFMSLLNIDLSVDGSISAEQAPKIIPLSNTLRRLSPTWENPYFPVSLMEEAILPGKANPIDHDKILPIRYQEKTLGTLIHHELYLWAEHATLMSQPLETHYLRWKAMLLESGLESHHIGWITEVMARVKSDPKAQYILSKHAHAHSEHEITAVIDGKIKTFILDRTFVDEQGTRVIVDYKTGEYHEDYWNQLNAYASVMKTLENRPVKLCLYFPVTGECYFS